MAGSITRGKITRADLANWDGRNATVSRTDASGGTVTGLSVGNEVDVLQVFGAGTERTDGTIQSAINYLGSTAATLVFAPGAWTISADVTIPANLPCVVPAGVVFTVASGKTLTFSGRVHVAYPGSWTSGSGTVSVAYSQQYYPRDATEISATIVPTRYEFDVGDLRRYGATGDGTTDDNAALVSLVAYVNAVALDSRPVEIVLPPGVYSYTTSLHFTRPVHLSGHGATLKFAGSGIAMKLGANSITGSDVFTQGEYTIDGVRFTGGANATHGIYLNDYVIEPRIINCTFEDFGKNTTYDIYAQYQNWNILIENCRKLTYSSTTAVGSFIAIVGTSTGGTSDSGNSRCTIRDCWMTSYDNQEMGYFAYVNSVKCRIIGGGFQVSNGGILLGGLASGTLIDGVYAELSTTGTPVYISVYSQDAGSGNYHHPQQVTVRNGYINMHQEVITNTGRMVATQDANVKLIEWCIEDMTIGNYAANQVLITQNDSTGQTGNRYARIKPLFVPSSSDDGSRFALRGSYSSAENWANYDSVGYVLSPAQITTTADDYAPTGIADATVLRLSTDTTQDITGIFAGHPGKELRIFNIGTQNLVLKNNVTSTAANRFLLGTDITLGADESILLWYDAASSRWRAVGRHN